MSKYDDHTDLVLTSFPHRKVTEVRIPLPVKEVELSDKPFGTTEIEPQYQVFYVDEIIWQEHIRNGTTGELINILQDAWYRKLGIRTTKEKAIDDANEYLDSLRRGIA